ncbi:hypothetical protein [Silvimonas sp.]|uniref:helix-turn-helix transcriptional regulator n=1 Tax=Silvimonas sp. TaxID=2650811 RepID=UPI0028489AAB|nr:hypothetical protein [Silvimonas sp.]MDR3428988.1 hypothetical protein [Silvimonas sp.]
MTIDTQLLDKLDTLIAVTKAVAIPLETRWLDADGVGTVLGFARRQVLENIACRPDFPQPLRIGGTGHPRWQASEVLQWASDHRKHQISYHYPSGSIDKSEVVARRKAGRPRKST